MNVIGVTGGVGAGKSRILEFLEREYGARVILTDEVARRILEPGGPGLKRVEEALGISLLLPDKSLDREKLASAIFHSPAARAAVDGIVHPLGWDEVRRLVRGSGAELAVVETALPDKNFDDICDEVWYVYTSEVNRIRRLMESRGYSEEKARSILASQPSEEEYRAHSCLVIDNDRAWEETRKQLENRMMKGR